MDTLNALWGGAESPSRRSINIARVARAAIPIAMIAAIVVLIFQVHFLSNEVAVARERNIAAFNQVTTASDRIQKVILGVDRIGMRVAALDMKVYTPIEISGFHNKDRFASAGYMTELSLFKAMPPAEQHEYLTMTKEAKQAKYGARL